MVCVGDMRVCLSDCLCEYSACACDYASLPTCGLQAKGQTFLLSKDASDLGKGSNYVAKVRHVWRGARAIVASIRVRAGARGFS